MSVTNGVLSTPTFSNAAENGQITGKRKWSQDVEEQKSMTTLAENRHEQAKRKTQFNEFLVSLLEMLRTYVLLLRQARVGQIVANGVQSRYHTIHS